MSERVERALRETRMEERLCICTVILEPGRSPETIPRYARDFAELYYTLMEIEHIVKLISYAVK